MGKLSVAFSRLLYPQPHCLLCGALVAQPGLCAACESQRRYFRPCVHCACFLPVAAASALCTDCMAALPAFTLARAALPYQGELRRALLGFKYHRQLWLQTPLSGLLLDIYRQWFAPLQPQLILPVPLSPQRLAERGYNQSALLARALAGQTGLPYREDLLLRRKDTPPLSRLNKQQRHRVLEGAFVCPFALNGARILLVDDIYTTGSTANGCAKALQAAGGGEVYVLTVASAKLS